MTDPDLCKPISIRSDHSSLRDGVAVDFDSVSRKPGSAQPPIRAHAATPDRAQKTVNRS
jgi:hypothetical protein